MWHIGNRVFVSELSVTSRHRPLFDSHCGEAMRALMNVRQLQMAVVALFTLGGLAAHATGEVPTGTTGGIKIVKTVNGAEMQDESPYSFTFEIRSGASAAYPGGEGTVVATGVASRDGWGRVWFPDLPFQTYQVCETGLLPGWTTSLSQDGGFIPNSAGNPNADATTVCRDLTVDQPWGFFVYVDNTPPPAMSPRTIGYWKNWSSCSKGNQTPVLDQTLASFTGSGLMMGTLFVDTCAEAVNLLDKSDVNGMKRATDPAYRLAAQLLAARLNVQAGAPNCAAVASAITDGNALLANVGFNGVSVYRGVINADAADLLAESLDQYNNGELCAQ